MERRFALVLDNRVQNVVMWNDDNGPLPLADGMLAIESEWASPDDWWDAEDQCFYRALPNAPSADDIITVEESE